MVYLLVPSLLLDTPVVVVVILVVGWIIRNISYLVIWQIGVVPGNEGHNFLKVCSVEEDEEVDN